ncbi:MAG: hypothetical protein PF637_03490 [Spirochaetes bacterium]|jgi:hypothetical protein|nr:hypothetical protein [Spirochaetota bacterium]
MNIICNRKNLLYIFTAACLFSTSLHGESTGVRGAFSRSGLVGAHNVAMGTAVEAISNDVFSIYWNPAGLTHLRRRKRSIREDVRINLHENKINKISERDLELLSDDTPKFFFQIGSSATILQAEREAAFIGGAFNIYNAVLGIGAFGIYSDDIDTYNESGTHTGNTAYQAGVSYFSFAYPTEYASIGITAKGLYENIDHTNYAGSAFDIGIQTDFIPLIQIGFVVQDVGIGLLRANQLDNARDEYEFGKPVFRFNVAILSRTANMTVSAGLIKKFEDEGSEFKFGVKYDLFSNVSFLLGVKESLFSTGCIFTVFNSDFAYALSVDNIDLGYNHTVSFAYLF